MAENKNDLDYQNEAYHEIEENKSVFQAFKDFFSRQKALPESIESKHKSTTIDMRTLMGLRSFRANIVERVGKFFSNLSKIGAPKSDENLNKFTKEVVGTQKKEVSPEKTRNDDETIVSQETRYFPGNVSLKQTPPSTETMVVAEITPEQGFKAETIDIGNIDIDIDNDRIEATTITVAAQPDLNKDSSQTSKNIIIPKASGKTIKSKGDDTITR